MFNIIMLCTLCFITGGQTAYWLIRKVIDGSEECPHCKTSVKKAFDKILRRK